jgi:hypothetical protein
MLLAAGITTMLILQALLNMAVIVAAAPRRDAALYQLETVRWWPRCLASAYCEHPSLWGGERRPGDGSGKVCL